MSEIITEIPPYLCQLANGSTLRYKYPGETGNQMEWLKNWLTNRCVELSHNKNKRMKPIVGYMNSGTDHCLLSADFDKIPEHLGIEESSKEAMLYWDNFAIHCQQVYSKVATVGRSCSDKVKVFFPVVLPPWTSLNKQEQILGLEQLLISEHFNLCDIAANSTNLTYLTPSIIGCLQNIKLLKPTRLILPTVLSPEKVTVFYSSPGLEQCSELNSESNINTMGNIVQPDTTEVSNKEYKVNRYNLIPELETKLCSWNSTHNRTMFTNKIVAMWGLISRKGFQISMKKMAQECGVSIECIAKYIKYFVKAGLLRCVNKRYRPHLIAKTYKASGILRKAISNHMELVTSGTSVLRSKLPKKIKDGQWEKKLYYLRFFFTTAKDYLQYVIKIPGIFKKDRKQKAERIAKRYFEDTG